MVSNGSKTTQYTVLKYRLHPTPEQIALIEKTFGCCRYLWNRMLTDVQEFYAATDIHYIPTPARYKISAPFLKDVDSQALCTVHQNLRQAFIGFFKNPAAFGYPQFKTKKSKRDSFTVYCRKYRTGPSIQLTPNGVQMPKLGFVKARIYRKPLHWWSLRFVTVSKSKSGKYFISVAYSYEPKIPKSVGPTPAKTLGLNYSSHGLYTDSNGNNLKLPGWIERSKIKLAKMQRKLSKMEYCSNNYMEQLQKIRLMHEHIANQRRDFIHKESRRIANDWDCVCVKNTNLQELSQLLYGTNVTDSGFGMFREFLKYKLARLGKTYIPVDKYTQTTKICHACGHVHNTLSPHETVWQCPNCGSKIQRDINTALNIKNLGLAIYHHHNILKSSA